VVKRAARAAAARRFPWRWLAVLTLVAAGGGTYANTLHNEFVYDDRFSILENPNIRSLWPLTRSCTGPPGSAGNGRPVAAFSLALNYALDGVHEPGYHVFNIVVHILAALVLFDLTLRTLRRSVWSADVQRHATAAGFVVALLWLVHPLHTAALNHVVYRNETLAALFCLITLACAERSADAARPWRWWVAAGLACLLAMGSKEIAAAWPLIVLLYDRAFVSGSFRGAWRARKALYIGLAATWIPLAALVATADRGASVGLDLEDVTPFQYARTQLGVVVHYLRLAFWPAPLVLDYKWPIASGWGDVAPQALLLAVLLGATLWATRRAPRLGFLGAWFFLVLVPTSTFVPLMGAVAAEHRMVLPLVPVIAGTIAALAALVRLRFLRTPVIVGLGVGTVAILLAARTVARNTDYRTHQRIWEDTLAKRPLNSRAHNNLGSVLAEAGRFNEASVHYEEALRISPQYPGAHDNLGTALFRLGDHDGAMQHFGAAIRLEPDYPKPHSNLASLLTRRGRFAEARRELDIALRLDPDYGMAHYNLGHVYLGVGQVDSAIAQFMRAADLLPYFPEAHNNVAVICLRRGDYARAIEHSRATLQIDANHVGALNNLAWILATCPVDALRDGQAALAYITRALQLAPDAPSHLDTHAAVLAELGNFDGAVAVAEQARQRAVGTNQPALAERLEQRLALYRQRLPYRMDAPGAP
jgi:tetratricopeptide (TPR) repeat protein